MWGSVDVDFVSSCAEEVALEGLDGITLSGLWVRLENRDKFPLPLDNRSKGFLWKAVVSHRAIEFFELPEPRSPLVIRNRFELMDPITGFMIESDTDVEDLYPVSVLKGAKEQGSCAAYSTRVNVTESVRDEDLEPKVTLEQAEQRWGERLVVVSSQEERLTVLLGPTMDPNVVLTDLMYCVLERIGRSRVMGEVSHGKLSLKAFCDPKTLFYVRKKLAKLGAIVQQVYHHRVGTTRFKSCVLLHLKRFSSPRKSPLKLMLRHIFDVLNPKPNRAEAHKILFQTLGLKEDTVKKFVRSHLSCIADFVLVPLREFYPDLPEDKYTYGNGSERCVKVIQLQEDVTEENFDSKVSATDRKDLDDDEDSQDETDQPAVSTGMLDFSRQYLDKTLLRQCYSMVEESGSRGLTMREIATKLGVRRVDARLFHQGLVATNLVNQMATDVGKQRTIRFIAKRVCNVAHDELVEECRRFLSFAGVTAEAMETVNVSNNGLLKEVIDLCRQDPADSQRTLSIRAVKRACRVLELVKTLKVVESPGVIKAAIKEEEAKEGVGRVDMKTVKRLIYLMMNDGLIKSMKTVFKFGTVEKKIHMVCDLGVSVKDELFQTMLQAVKFKNFAVGSTEAKDIVKKSAQHPKGDVKLKMEYVPRIGYVYGYEPKFLRMKTFHKFICYLALDYGGDRSKVTIEERRAIEDQLPADFELPTIHHGQLSWKTFVPPAPTYSDKGWPARWIQLSDVLFRMPLSLFVKIVNVTFKIDGMMDYLDHPVKRHLLVSQLPVEMANILLFARKYIFVAYEVSAKLCYMGLLSFSPYSIKEKEQVMLYVHRKATLKDTKTTNPGYMAISPECPEAPYERLLYALDTVDDVDLFWRTLEDICMRTPLGSYIASLGQSVTIELPHKKASLLDSFQPKTANQIKDTGHIPGDGLGAGGLDSSLFSHLRRNWQWINVDLKRKKQLDAEKKAVKKKGGAKVAADDPGHQKRLGRLADNRHILTVRRDVTNSECDTVGNLEKGPETPRKRKTVTELKRKSKRKKSDKVTVRTVKRRNKKIRRPFYDEVDKAALRRMKQLRVNWTDQEDSFLLLCKVTSLLLEPTARSLFVSGACVRDLLNQHCPTISMNKTSRACSRRMRYMMMNSGTAYNVSVFVGEAKQDQEMMRLCEAPKPLKTDEEGCRAIFVPLVRKLVEKFKVESWQLSTALELPSTLAELESTYSLVLTDKFVRADTRHHDVKNVVDIHCSVAYSLLIGALGVDKDKNNWSYHLYHILQQYPDNLLRSVFATLRTDYIVSASKKRPRAMKGFSLVSIPYQLSITFCRIFVTLVREELYAEASELVGQLIEDAVQGGDGVPVHGDTVGGFTSVFQACSATGRISRKFTVPEQVLVFDRDAFDRSRKADGKLRENYEDWWRLKEEEGIVSEGMKSTNASRFALYMLRQQLTTAPGHKHNTSEYLVINSCPILCKIKEDFVLSKEVTDAFEVRLNRMLPVDIPRFETFLEGFQGPLEIAASSELYNIILQQKELGIKEHDLELVYADKEFEKLYDGLKALIDGNQVIRVGVTVPRYVAMVHGNPWILNSVRVSKEEKAEALQAVALMEEASASVEKAEEKTTEAEEDVVWPSRRNSARAKGPKVQQDASLRNRKVVRLVYRPWRKPDGTINRPMLNQMLRGVAGSVILNPGIPVRELCGKFLPALQPVQVLELVDMLVEAGCFHQYFLTVPTVVSAFSKPKTFEVTSTKRGPSDAVYLEADVECIPKMAQLFKLHPWSKKWKKFVGTPERMEVDAVT